MKYNGLSDKQQTVLITILKNNNRVKSACLFGSRAIGTYKENSDIDIVLIGDELTLTDLANLLNQIELTTIPYKVDLLIKHKIKNSALLEHIDKLAVKLF